MTEKSRKVLLKKLLEAELKLRRQSNSIVKVQLTLNELRFLIEKISSIEEALNELGLTTKLS